MRGPAKSKLVAEAQKRNFKSYGINYSAAVSHRGTPTDAATAALITDDARHIRGCVHRILGADFHLNDPSSEPVRARAAAGRAGGVEAATTGDSAAGLAVDLSDDPNHSRFGHLFWREGGRPLPLAGRRKLAGGETVV